jgi:L-iditol 2-dehydrogenase
MYPFSTRMTYMKSASAIQFVAPGQVRMVEVETPAPGPGEVLIRTIATALCNHSELRSYHGGSREAYGSRYPMLPGEPGHEGVGIVESVGADVSTFSPGDTVVLTGWGGDPAHRSMVLREVSQIAGIVPGDRDPAEASILEMFASAYHCVKRGWEGGRYENARVGIVGMGAIGLCSLQCIRLWPVGEIVAFDLSRQKLQIAEDLGADRSFLLARDVEPDDLESSCGRFDLVVECTGATGGQAIAQGLSPGVVINVSYISDPISVDQTAWFRSETTVYNPGLPRANDLQAVASLYNRGLIDPGPLISSRIKPDVADYLGAIQEIQKGEIVKTLIMWDRT